MATRLYLTDTDADIIPTAKAGADNATNALSKKLGQSKAGSVTPLTIYNAGSSETYYKFVSPPLGSDFTFSSSSTLTAVILENDQYGDNYSFAYPYVYITQGNSTTLVRGVYVDISFSSAAIGMSSASPKGIPMSEADSFYPRTTVNALVGDRIVFEVGAFRFVAGYGPPSNILIYRGGTDATDLTTNDTTSTHPGWIEFGQTIPFAKTITRVAILE